MTAISKDNVGSRMLWPLPFVPSYIPEGDHPGAFGARRKHDIHTGIDLYCEPHQPVMAMETGIVVGVEDFTGSRAGSPWWNETQAVLVSGASGTILYGEIMPCVSVGDQVNPGQCVGWVLTVLKNDKGKPMAMLHLELYEKGITESAWWRLDEVRPKGLLDPTGLLKEARANEVLKEVYNGTMERSG